MNLYQPIQLKNKYFSEIAMLQCTFPNKNVWLIFAFSLNLNFVTDTVQFNKNIVLLSKVLLTVQIETLLVQRWIKQLKGLSADRCTLPGDANANLASYPATSESHCSTGCFSTRCSNNTRLEDKESEPSLCIVR